MGRILARGVSCVLLGMAIAAWFAPEATAQKVTYEPYIALGDAGPFGINDQMVVAWQTDESMSNPSSYKVEFGTTLGDGAAVTPSGRVVDNYLSADITLPVPPTASGPHSNYAAVLKNLA